MSSLYFTVAAIGVAAQLYISPIPEVSTAKVLGAYFAGNFVIFSYLVSTCDRPEYFVSLVFSPLFYANTVFLLTAATLTAIRRLWFSPLSKLPGPRLAAISKIWEANEYRLGRAAATKKRLHAKYGTDVVRIGPNEVSINDVNAVEKIYAGNYVRGPFYEIGVVKGGCNLNTTRDYEMHAPWRRIWEKAFQADALKDYNLAVEYHIGKLTDVVKKTAVAGQEVNFTQMIENVVFDIMADLSFGEDAGMQDGTGDGVYMSSLHKHTSAMRLPGALRNLAQLLPHLPTTDGLEPLRKRSEQMLADRQAVGSSRKDIFRHLIAEDSETGSRFNQAELLSNANLVIAAGTDTTSTVLTQTFRMLAKEPRIMKKMQKEIDRLCAGGKPLTIESAKKLDYVSAVISEALRLFNPFPSGIQATTPPQGVQIGEIHVPGNVQVRIPHLALMTDERYFPRGDEFVPERWTGERPELVLDRRAYIPFGYGVHACVGQQLALNEMRLVLARVARGFDVVFGELYDEGKFVGDWKDYHEVQLGPLWLKFTPRR